MLTQKLNLAQVEKVLQTIAAPAIIEFTDVNTQNNNSVLTPGGIAQVIGEELKFNPANAAEGIYFIATDGTATKVDVIASRTEGKLVFSIPNSLTPGSYVLEVRKGYGTTNIVVRIGSLQESLQVN